MIKLNMPFKVWSESVREGSVAVKREAAKEYAARLDAILKPKMERALFELMAFGHTEFSV